MSGELSGLKTPFHKLIFAGCRPQGGRENREVQICTCPKVAGSGSVSKLQDGKSRLVAVILEYPVFTLVIVADKGFLSTEHMRPFFPYSLCQLIPSKGLAPFACILSYLLTSAVQHVLGGHQMTSCRGE